MTSNEFSDEILMSFADGEADDETAARIAAAIDADPAVAKRVAFFMETRHLAREALRPMLAEPVPEPLLRGVSDAIARKRGNGAQVVSLAERRKPLLGRTWSQLAIAASVAAVIGGVAGYTLSPVGDPDRGLQVAGLNSAALVDALSTVPSGQQFILPGSNRRFIGIASFRDADMSLCREFELDTPDEPTILSVACHAPRAWEVRFAVIAPGNASGYAPASSTETLDAYLTAIGSGDPLSVDAETTALNEVRAARSQAVE